MGKAGKLGQMLQHHRLSGTATGDARLPRLIAAIKDRSLGQIRLFFGSGADLGAVAPDGGQGCALPLELRAISGGLMVTTGPGDKLALVNAAALRFDALPDETELFAGLNVALAFRLEESVESVAAWLAYHAETHGLQGALIVNRLSTAPGFAADLAQALGPTSLRIVVLDTDFPLGKPDTGPENHIFLAPDAPGKDRMTPPAPDAWRAPLGDGVIFELLKWRYLSQARAVLTLDVTDIIPPGTANPFDACVAAKGGVVLLAGRRIYPWRVRPGQEPQFGDHICRQFDSRRGIARWGVAPAVA
ncbi:MAG: glycosyltransferase family 2 protein, partial [Paracoccaceae bacterium]